MHQRDDTALPFLGESVEDLITLGEGVCLQSLEIILTNVKERLQGCGFR